MPKYIERMTVECDELKGRINRAKKAVENPPFGSTLEGLNLLEAQIEAMERYLAILEKRIEYEKSKGE
jgi:hypothetical protein